MNEQINKNPNLQEKQLHEFETLINWQVLVELIAHHYVVSNNDKCKVSVESMVRIYFLRKRLSLSASEAAIALAKIDTLRNFALIDIKTDVLPEEVSIKAFSELIEKRSLKEIFIREFNIIPALH